MSDKTSGLSFNLTGPNTSGNYSITIDNYIDGTSTSYDAFCRAGYGNPTVYKAFYFSTLTIQRKYYHVYLAMYYDNVQFNNSINIEDFFDLKNSHIYLNNEEYYLNLGFTGIYHAWGNTDYGNEFSSSLAPSAMGLNKGIWFINLSNYISSDKLTFPDVKITFCYNSNFVKRKNVDPIVFKLLYGIYYRDVDPLNYTGDSVDTYGSASITTNDEFTIHQDDINNENIETIIPRYNGIEWVQGEEFGSTNIFVLPEVFNKFKTTISLIKQALYGNIIFTYGSGNIIQSGSNAALNVLIRYGSTFGSSCYILESTKNKEISFNYGDAISVYNTKENPVRFIFDMMDWEVQMYTDSPMVVTFNIAFDSNYIQICELESTAEENGMFYISRTFEECLQALGWSEDTIDPYFTNASLLEVYHETKLANVSLYDRRFLIFYDKSQYIGNYEVDLYDYGFAQCAGAAALMISPNITSNSIDITVMAGIAGQYNTNNVTKGKVYDFANQLYPLVNYAVRAKSVINDKETYIEFGFRF